MKKILTISSALFAAYLTAENTLMLNVRRENAGTGVRIAHISDLHKRRFGRDNSRISGIVRAEEPDIIFITGDIVSRDQTDISDAVQLVKTLCSIAPVYMISGNHEQSLLPDIRERFSIEIARTDAVWLRNERADITVKGRDISIYGLMEDYSTYKKNGGYRDLDKITADDIRSLIGTPDGKVNILLAHNPLFGEAYAEWGADFAFSGHVHGGAVRLFGKGILSPERRFFPKYSKGIYRIGGMKLCVSAGIGKLRMFNAPEIVMYE